MLILNHREVDTVLDMRASIKALEKAYCDMASGDAINRPRTHTFIGTRNPDTFYLLKSMEGGIPQLGVMALRINSERWRLSSQGDYRWVEKLPTTDDGRYTEFILLFSIENGELLAILPDGHIQRFRVSATTALAAKYLACPDARNLALYGSGWQAETQIKALCEVLPIENVKVYSPTPDHRRNFAQRLSHNLNLQVEAVEEPKAAMEACDIVAIATNSERPVIQHEWLRKGLHLSAIRGPEIDNYILRSCDLVVVHHSVQAMDFVGGGKIPKEMCTKISNLKTLGFPQLSDVVAGIHPGRTSSDQITLFFQGGEGGVGLGIQFAAIGKLVYEEARRQGLGEEVPTEWFLDIERHPYQE